jgi:hypothetical protein
MPKADLWHHGYQALPVYPNGGVNIPEISYQLSVISCQISLGKSLPWAFA